MPLLNYNDLEDILRAYPGGVSVRLAVRVGSQVYGTATPESDTDFVVVGLEGKESDLLFGRDYNVTLWSNEKFHRLLDEHNVLAFEVASAPPDHILKSDPAAKILSTVLWSQIATSAFDTTSAVGKSTSDWKKGLKLMGYETGKAKKKLWHSLRVPLFAQQLVRGHITDFTVANGLFEEIMTDPSEDPEHYRAHYGPVRDEILMSLVS